MNVYIQLWRNWSEELKFLLNFNYFLKQIYLDERDIYLIPGGANT